MDIDGRAVHVSDPAIGADRVIPVRSRVGAAAWTTNEGSVLVALADRLALLDLADESLTTLVEIPHAGHMRMNDGACDAAGRFWVGSMALAVTPGAAALYRYEAENVTACCFGGDVGRSLFITTAAPAGSVFVTDVGVSGPPAHRFRHDG